MLTPTPMYTTRASYEGATTFGVDVSSLELEKNGGPPIGSGLAFFLVHADVTVHEIESIREESC